MSQLFPFIPPQASNFALGIDAVFWTITGVCLAFGVGVAFFLFLFVSRYRQGNKVNRVLPHHEGIALEMIWTIIPLVIALGLFVFSTVVYFATVRSPRDATEIFVVGKQWMWKLQHPNGRWEMNELHLPVGRPVKLTMISEDVIHSFGVPAFRLNMDVVPGRYTSLWFTPTRVGRYHLFCSQYCGTNHAIMGGYITVMEPDQFERWMQTGNVSTSLASRGETLFRENGCTGCHGPNASVRAPNLANIYGSERPVQVPNGRAWSPDMPVQTVIADYRYLHDSIILPAKEIVAGYQPIMPSYQGRLSTEDIIALIDYMKSLSTSNGTSNGLALGYDPLPGQVRTENPPRLSGTGDASSGQMLRTNPTGDLTNRLDRDAIYRGAFEVGTVNDASTGQMARGSATGDMNNRRDREVIFRGGGLADNLASIDRSAGGMRGRNNDNRGSLNPYDTPQYTESVTQAMTGLRAQPVGEAASDARPSPAQAQSGQNRLGGVGTNVPRGFGETTDQRAANARERSGSTTTTSQSAARVQIERAQAGLESGDSR